MGKATEEWSFGDLDAGFAARRPRARRDLRRAVHRTPSARNAQRDGLLAERQALSALLDAERGPHGGRRGALGRHRAVAGRADQRVHAAAASAARAAASVTMAIPALLSKKAERAGDDARQPRGGELLRPRAHQHGRPREDRASRKDGRITALDLFIVQDSGPYGPMGDHRSAGQRRVAHLSAGARCAGARSTCSPTRRRARSSARPGRCRPTASSSRSSPRPRKQLGLDQVAIRRINSPEGKALYGPPAANGQRRHVTGAFVKEALDRGAELFDWQTRVARSGQRRGSEGPRRRRRRRAARRRDRSATTA